MKQQKYVTGVAEVMLYSDHMDGADDGVRYNIVTEVKNQCTFYKIIKVNYTNNAACYSCSGSKYKGKIGFYIEDGNGYIVHIMP